MALVNGAYKHSRHLKKRKKKEKKKVVAFARKIQRQSFLGCCCFVCFTQDGRPIGRPNATDYTDPYVTHMDLKYVTDLGTFESSAHLYLVLRHTHI